MASGTRLVGAQARRSAPTTQTPTGPSAGGCLAGEGRVDGAEARGEEAGGELQRGSSGERRPGGANGRRADAEHPGVG